MRPQTKARKPMRSKALLKAGTAAMFTLAIFLGICILALIPTTAAMQQTEHKMRSLAGDEAAEDLRKNSSYASLEEAIGAIDDLFSPTAQTKLTRGVSGEAFGASVAISGDTAIIGAIAGKAYVFVRNGSSWTFLQQLTPSSVTSLSQFGSSVSISGDTAIIGALGDNNHNGSAFIFVRNGNGWTEQQKLVLAGGYECGASSALVANTAVMGCPGGTGHGVGHAPVYVRSGSTWTIQQNLSPADVVESDRFGQSMSISGESLLVGSYNQGTPNPAGSGAAYVFIRNGTSWTKQQKLTASDPTGSAAFGTSVAISGNTAVMGAPRATVTNPAQGAAYVFSRNGTIWSQQQKLTAPDAGTSDSFGYSMSLFGETLVIGAPFDDVGSNTDQGSAYVFHGCSNQPWTLQQKVVAFDGGNEYQFSSNKDEFGHSVVVSAESVLVGAWTDDAAPDFNQIDFGAVYVTPQSDLTPTTPCQAELKVNITTDQSDANTADDICDVDTAQSGQQCSLRAAIQTANAKAGPDEIKFDIPGSGVRTIAVSSDLPAIIQPTTIDAKTQPGYTVSPLIELSGSGTSINSDGLVFSTGSDGSILSGIIINQFGNSGLVIAANSVTVAKSWIGVHNDGITLDIAGRQRRGITITGANNTIGGERTTVESGGNTIVAGNSIEEIKISGTGATGNTVIGTAVGFTLSDDTRLIDETDGIRINNGASGNIIGKSEILLRNIITGDYGIDIEHSDGNFIINNGIGGCGNGIVIRNSKNNTIGGEVRSAEGYNDRNLIVNNGYGIFLGDVLEGKAERLAVPDPPPNGDFCSDNPDRSAIFRKQSPGSGAASETTGNKILGNLIGIRTDTDPINEFKNCVGVYIAVASGNFVGSDQPNYYNFISGNANAGVVIMDEGTENTIQKNYIGTSRTGVSPYPNFEGVVIAGNQNKVLFNRIGGNTKSGVVIDAPFDDDPPPTGNIISQNEIGFGSGFSTVPNETGIYVNGTVTTIKNNLISGNTRAGIDVLYDHNLIQNNQIGTDETGQFARPNRGFGILITSSNNTVLGNLISGNESGLTISRAIETPNQPASGNIVEGNYIGTNSQGTAELRNETAGIAIANGASDNLIGGTTAAARNIVSGNGQVGIYVTKGVAQGARSPVSNKIQGNYIGTNASGTSAIPNGEAGIGVDGSLSTLIGGFGADMPGARNIISGNGNHGIFLGDHASQNRVSGNYIGTAADGTTALGNVGNGIFLQQGVGSTMIGGHEPNAGNTIAYNAKNGILLAADAGNNNIIDPNRIFGNALHGIDIGEDGFTANDPTDADVGPNKRQNYPTMTFSVNGGGDLIVNYQVDSAPQHSTYGAAGIYVEFFEADATGAGSDFLGSDHFLLSNYTNGAPGTRQKNLGNAAALGFAPNDKMTATATDADGNSSEFTPAVSGPAASPVNVGGRVTTPTGIGLRNAVVTMIDALGVRRTATTSSFGLYSFTNVAAGGSYTITVASKRYRFAPRVMVISDNLSNVDFVGLE